MSIKLFWKIGILVSCVCLLTACGSIAVQGRVSAIVNSAQREVANLNFTRGDVESSGQPYLIAANGRAESERALDVAVQLRADVTGTPGPSHLQEIYHLLQIVTPFEQFSGGTAPDRNFVIQNIGNIVHLSVTPGQQRSGSQNGVQHIGSTWIAVVTDQARVVPWRIQSGETHCLTIAAADCFDMESLTRLMFLSIADRVSETVAVQIPLGSAVKHQLFYVPRVINEGLEQTARRARGFSFVYSVRIEAPLFAFNVFVPVSFLFLPDFQDYRLIIDPFSFSGEHRQNLDRIYVKGELLGGLTESFVRDAIVQGLDAVKLPNLPLTNPQLNFESAVLGGIAGVAGLTPTFGENHQVSSRYEAILIPEDDGNATGPSIVWTRDGNTDPPVQAQPVKLIFIEPR